MASNTLNVVGRVTQVSEADAQRLSAFIIRCDVILASAPILADGTYRITVSRAAALAASPYATTLAIAPATAGNHLDHFPGVPKVALARTDLEKATKEFRIADVPISEATLRIWWLQCRWYCVSGTVVGPDRCAAPGAEVTVYTVTHTGSGYTKVPRATVTTGPNGSFTACFEWCTCTFCLPCWPCWPVWWSCWPWWWELDILRVIENIEKQPVLPGPGPVQALPSAASLIRPDARSLIRGQGFGIASAESSSPDPQRTALIASKFANARIRELFPWWWWCCDDPNILFSVTQNGNLIVNENPATNTLWCLEDGSSVSLVGNSNTSTVCNPSCPPESGFAWTNVGDYIEVAAIDKGYANPSGFGVDYRDMAFAGELFLYGQFATSSTVAYYQVLAAQWAGNPARGGSQPPVGSGPPIAEPLDRGVYIYNADATFNSYVVVRMGPFTQGGLANLYATPDARQGGPTPPGLAAFPVVPPGGQVFWDHQGLVAHTYDSSNLISGLPTGAVDLAVVGYDATFAQVLTPTVPPAGPPDAPLTLMIDNTGLSMAKINNITAFKQNGTPVTSTTSGPCPTYDLGPGGYVQISVTVTDNNGHLFEYQLNSNYGSSAGGVISPPGTRGYISNPLTSPAPAGVCSAGDPDYNCKSWVGGTEVITYYPPVDCCYEFLLQVGKRVTNGDSFPGLADDGFQTMTLTVSS